MKTFEFLGEALKISVNRCATQVSSIVIIGMLGFESTELLAAFSLGLSAAAIFFVANTAIQYGVQSELSKSFGEGNQRDLFGIFFAGFWFMLGISFVAVGMAYLLPSPFSSIENSTIRESAFLAYRVLVLSMPVVAFSAAIQFLLEAHQRVSTVFKLRLMTVSLQLIAVVWLLHGNATAQAKDISWAYFATDMIGLILSVIACAFHVDRKSLMKAARASFSLAAKNNSYLRALKSGGPVAVGAISQKYLFYYISVYCASLGTASASAFAILNSVVFLLQIPLIGLAHLATIKFSFAYGSNDPVLLDSSRKTINKILFPMVFSIGLISWIALPKIVQLFSQDAIVASSIVDLSYLFFIFFLLNCFLSLILGMLRGLSDSIYPQLAVNLILFLVLVPALQWNTVVSFSQVIGLFCATGFVVVAGLVARWTKKLNEAVVALTPKVEA